MVLDGTFQSFFTFFSVPGGVCVKSFIASVCNVGCADFINFCSIKVHSLNSVSSSRAKSLLDLSSASC